MSSNRRWWAVPALAATVALGACDDGLTEINQNPNNPEEVPVQAVLQSGLWDLVDNAAGRGVFGGWTTLYHTNLWAQHTAQSQYNEEDNYNPREGINERIWEEMYAGPLSDLQRVKALAEESGDDNLWAVAEIAQVYGFLFLTDLFGDVPYEQALNVDEYPFPAYTPQAEIYPDLIARLKAATARIDPSASVGWQTGDLIYNGSVQGWREFGNSLRLRIAMRMADTELAGLAQQEFVAAWDDDIFDSVGDVADLNWSGSLPAQNPNYEQIIQGNRTGDFRVSAALLDRLVATNDPRLPVYADPAVLDGAYRGLPNGAVPLEIGRTAAEISWIGAYFLRPDAPSVLMSYAEVLFLGAEAAARGWIGGAEELYRAGIEASMQQYGIAQGEIDAFLAQPAVAYQGLPSIGEQKWLALYMAGPEAYAEVRRTGYPELELPRKAAIDRIPTRMPYPPSEGLYNGANFKPYADADFTQPLWWMPS